ncbi:hypothetical protein J2TS6_59760 [Paenibacillus albilobatus]|uniref:Uncharacterized protein n=2 Tax=Paenibacillus TaxID=44249 RepID=A0A919XQV2_9BACL|nr:hypothetical protein J2TS6_59760 [Paenibacillus albilobatus]
MDIYSLKWGKGLFHRPLHGRTLEKDLCGDKLMLSEIQQEALNKAQTHGGKLVRWRQGGYWTYEGAVSNIKDRSPKVSDLEWYCTTNTIFALVRRGFMAMEDWENCLVIPEEAKEETDIKEL